MKKTLITLLAAAACAMAGDTLSYKTNAIGTPNAAYVHGFTFTIKADTIAPISEQQPKTFTGDYYLNKLTLAGRDAIRRPVSFKLMVMEPTTLSIIGLSNEAPTATPGIDYTFTFNNLKLNSETTYLVATVDGNVTPESVLGKTYAPSTGNLAITDTVVSGGLMDPGFAVDLHNEQPTEGLNFTVRANLSEAEGGWSPVLKELVITDANPPEEECTLCTPILFGIGGVALLGVILGISAATKRQKA